YTLPGQLLLEALHVPALVVLHHVRTALVVPLEDDVFSLLIGEADLRAMRIGCGERGCRRTDGWSGNGAPRCRRRQDGHGEQIPHDPHVRFLLSSSSSSVMTISVVNNCGRMRGGPS